jgi:hypothetical protein
MGCFDSSLLSFLSLLYFRHFTPHSSQHGSVPSHRFEVGGPFVSFSFTASLLCQPSPEPAAYLASHPPALSTGLRLRLVRISVVLSNVVGSFIGCQSCLVCLNHGCCKTARWTDLLSCFGPHRHISTHASHRQPSCPVRLDKETRSRRFRNSVQSAASLRSESGWSLTCFSCHRFALFFNKHSQSLGLILSVGIFAFCRYSLSRLSRSLPDWTQPSPTRKLKPPGKVVSEVRGW